MDGPAADVVLRIHIMHLFHIRLHPPLNERGVSDVNLQVNTTDHQRRNTNALKLNYQQDRIIKSDLETTQWHKSETVFTGSLLKSLTH